MSSPEHAECEQISQLLLIRFGPNFKGSFMGQSSRWHLSKQHMSWWHLSILCLSYHLPRFWTQFFGGPNFCTPPFFGPSFIWSKSFLDPQIFGPNFFLTPKFFGPKILNSIFCTYFFLDSKFVWDLNSFGPKFLEKIFLDKLKSSESVWFYFVWSIYWIKNTHSLQNTIKHAW